MGFNSGFKGLKYKISLCIFSLNSAYFFKHVLFCKLFSSVLQSPLEGRLTGLFTLCLGTDF